MTDSLNVHVDRVEQNRKAREERLAELTTRTPSPHGRLGATHAPGDKVFDRVSGESGEVIGVRRENVVVPSAK